jgi:hypothetical protein
MTDNLPAVPTIPSAASPYDDWQARKKLNEKTITLNKASILEALKLSGISKVLIEFNGSGDDGGIESITCDGDTAIPDLSVKEWAFADENAPIDKEVKLGIAIENFAYELLAHTESGWENNAGAFGEITIDVSTGTAVHTHNSRFEDYSTSSHTY